MANVMAPDHMLLSNLKGLFLELDPADTGRVPFARLQRELEASALHSTGVGFG